VARIFLRPEGDLLNLEEVIRLPPSLSCPDVFCPCLVTFLEIDIREKIAMTPTDRRTFLGVVALGAGGLASTAALAAPNDGHAAGYDVAPSANFLPTIPRKTGDAMTFTANLDKGPIKATSGGWARDLTTRQLPIATDIAGAHLFMNAGGSREMHWHNSAEWAYILAGHCQVTVVDPDGALEVANYGPGDLWYFPKGHGHAVHTLGSEACHAVLAFDDGLYGEHGTFGLSDWMSRLEPGLLAKSLGVDEKWLAKLPSGETYIMQGDVIPRDGPQARTARELSPAQTHRFALMAQKPYASSAGGTLHIASSREFPLSTTLTGMVLRLKPGAAHAPHWHPNANEWHYVAKGRAKVTLFGIDKRLATAEIGIGDVAYIPRGCAHTVQSIGAEQCEIVGVLDAAAYQEASMWSWIAKAPRHLLANNLGVAESFVPSLAGERPVIVAAG
jgi:oxalate decarboxylase